MSQRRPRPTRMRRGRLAALLVVLAAAVAVSDEPLPDPASSTAAPPSVPESRGLDRDLATALRRATREASAQGVALVVVSGRRTPEHQQQLLEEAVAEYGSLEEASRWVATPERSAHVSGDAVDVGPEGAEWLSRHGAVYGLCQVYGNEPWHFELRPGSAVEGCPATYPDPTHDPRMQP